MTVVLREARKEALPYRRHAVEVLGKVADAFDADLFTTVFEMLSPLFAVPEEKEGEMEQDDEDDKEEGQQLMMLELHEAAILALGRAFPSNHVTQSIFFNKFIVDFKLLILLFFKVNVGRLIWNFCGRPWRIQLDQCSWQLYRHCCRWRVKWHHSFWPISLKNRTAF